MDQIQRTLGARIQHWLERGGTSMWRRSLSLGAIEVARLRRRRHTAALPAVPTIVVGSLAMGGAGKTQVVAYLASRFGRQCRVGIVCRGYPHRHSHPVEVRQGDLRGLGDEAQMLKAQLGKRARIWVATNLEQGRRAAEAESDVVLVDDGFQSPRLRRSFTVCVVDPSMARGVVPAGPLREPWAAVASADLLWCHGAKPSRTLQTEWRGRLVHSTARLAGCCDSDGQARGAHWLRGKEIQTVCGIARPQRFYRLLTDAGAVIGGGYEVHDHANFSESVLKAMMHSGQPICITEKDATRVPAWVRPYTVRVGLEVRCTEPLAVLDGVLGCG